MTKYGAWGEKMMYGKKKIGVIRSTVWIGPKGEVKRHWKKVAERRGPPRAGARGAAVRDLSLSGRREAVAGLTRFRALG